MTAALPHQGPDTGARSDPAILRNSVRPAGMLPYRASRLRPDLFQVHVRQERVLQKRDTPGTWIIGSRPAGWPPSENS